MHIIVYGTALTVTVEGMPWQKFKFFEFGDSKSGQLVHLPQWRQVRGDRYYPRVFWTSKTLLPGKFLNTAPCQTIDIFCSIYTATYWYAKSGTLVSKSGLLQRGPEG